MPLTSVRIQNFRSIVDSGTLDLGPITVLIGANNTGKSALLRAIHMVQGGGHIDDADLRHGQTEVSVEVHLTDPLPTALEEIKTGAGLPYVERLRVRASRARDSSETKVNLRWATSSEHASRSISGTRPHHLTVPILARRKSQEYDTNVRLDLANEVDIGDRNLTSRINSLSSGNHSEGNHYRRIVRSVLDLEVHTFMMNDGHYPGERSHLVRAPVSTGWVKVSPTSCTSRPNSYRQEGVSSSSTSLRTTSTPTRS